MSKPWKEWTKKGLYEAWGDERRTRADYQDLLNDLTNGIERWKNVKIGGLNWDDEDEALIRWIEGSDLRNFDV